MSSQKPAPSDERKRKKMRRNDSSDDNHGPYQGQDELRLRAINQLALEGQPSSTVRASSSFLSSSPSSSSSVSARAFSSPIVSSTTRDRNSASDEQKEIYLIDRETQTDEWRVLICENCGGEFNEDDDSVLCVECVFWKHYKCLKRSVYDGDCADGDQCVFCHALRHRLPRQDILMNNQVKMQDNTLIENDPDLPRGSSESWQHYWNIRRLTDGRNFKVGDYVYIPDNERSVVVIWFINYLIRDSESTPFACVTELCFPENIMRFDRQRFYKNEVYELTELGKTTPSLIFARLDQLRGPSLVTLSVLEYRKYIPRGIAKNHVYIERNYYDRSHSNPKKYTTKQCKVGDYTTCIENFALKLRPRPLDPTTHTEKKFEKIKWEEIRIKVSDLTLS